MPAGFNCLLTYILTRMQLEAVLNYCYCGNKDYKEAMPRKDLLKKIKNRIRNRRGGFIKER